MSTVTKKREKQIEPTTPDLTQLELEAVQEVESGPSITKLETISERVKRYILEKSGTLSEISRVTSVPKTTLTGWLNGHKELTTGVFDKICEAYGIHPFRFFGEDSDFVPVAHKTQEHLVKVHEEVLFETKAMERLSKEHEEERNRLTDLLKWYHGKIDHLTFANAHLTATLDETNRQLGKMIASYEERQNKKKVANE